ncbi:MAG: hypothetical protein MHPSP_002638, partial [Paramarteilia canceri]
IEENYQTISGNVKKNRSLLNKVNDRFNKYAGLYTKSSLFKNNFDNIMENLTSKQSCQDIPLYLQELFTLENQLNEVKEFQVNNGFVGHRGLIDFSNKTNIIYMAGGKDFQQILKIKQNESDSILQKNTELSLNSQIKQLEIIKKKMLVVRTLDEVKLIKWSKNPKIIASSNFDNLRFFHNVPPMQSTLIVNNADQIIFLDIEKNVQHINFQIEGLQNAERSSVKMLNSPFFCSLMTEENFQLIDLREKNRTHPSKIESIDESLFSQAILDTQNILLVSRSSAHLVDFRNLSRPKDSKKLNIRGYPSLIEHDSEIGTDVYIGCLESKEIRKATSDSKLDIFNVKSVDEYFKNLESADIEQYYQYFNKVLCLTGIKLMKLKDGSVSLLISDSAGNLYEQSLRNLTSSDSSRNKFLPHDFVKPLSDSADKFEISLPVEIF